jgi:hypothetical protein
LRPVQIRCPLCGTPLGVIGLQPEIFGEDVPLMVSIECEGGGLKHHSLVVESPVPPAPPTEPEQPTEAD